MIDPGTVPSLSSRPVEREEERVPVFTLDGETYTIPKNPPASLVLRYLRAARQHGEEHASAQLLEDLLGEENYEALMNCPTLTLEEFGQIMDIVAQYSLGLMRRYVEVAGNSERG